MNDNRDFDGSKLDGVDVSLTPKGPFFEKLDNFWYHNKWKVIIITFFAIVFIVGIVQIVGKTDPDATIVVAVPEAVTPLQSAEISSSLVSLMPGDSNGDGKKEVQIIAYAVYSEEEFEEANHTEIETEADGGLHYVPVVNQSYNAEQYDEYSKYLLTGEATILFVSEYLYSNLIANDRVLPLSEVFGDDLPAVAALMGDGYGVRLGDLAIYDYVDALNVIPEDTMVCILRPYIWGASSKADKYEYSKSLFENILLFGE